MPDTRPDDTPKAAGPAGRAERPLAIIMAMLTLVAGVAARSGTLSPAAAKPVGVALWCTLVYWLVVFAGPRLALHRACLVAIALGWAVELLQLTPGPARLAALFPPSRWVLGRVFHAPDLAAYVVGAVAAAGLHATARHLTRRGVFPPERMTRNLR